MVTMTMMRTMRRNMTNDDDEDVAPALINFHT